MDFVVGANAQDDSSKQDNHPGKGDGYNHLDGAGFHFITGIANPSSILASAPGGQPRTVAAGTSEGRFHKSRKPQWLPDKPLGLHFTSGQQVYHQ
jgi:hypothetical protein